MRPRVTHYTTDIRSKLETTRPEKFHKHFVRTVFLKGLFTTPSLKAICLERFSGLTLGSMSLLYYKSNDIEPLRGQRTEGREGGVEFEREA